MEEIVRNQLRLPSQLHNKLRELAANSGRSLNAEIVFRLSASVEGNQYRNFSTADSAERLTRPEHRQELETVVAAIQRVLSADS